MIVEPCSRRIVGIFEQAAVRLRGRGKTGKANMQRAAVGAALCNSGDCNFGNDGACRAVFRSF
jgi:hypothetical protein